MASSQADATTCHGSATNQEDVPLLPAKGNDDTEENAQAAQVYTVDQQPSEDTAAMMEPKSGSVTSRFTETTDLQEWIEQWMPKTKTKAQAKAAKSSRRLASWKRRVASSSGEKTLFSRACKFLYADKWSQQ